MLNTLIKKEVFFVKFPIIFPIIYIFILFSFPALETQLIFITILLLAETHFGATWPFFINKVNYSYIKEKKINLVFFPFIVVLFCLLGFFLFKKLFLLVFFAANVFHVTRQSFGVMNLYTQNKVEKKNYVFAIYFFNFIFFLIAFFRFYIPLIKEDYLIILNLIVVFSLLVLFIYNLSKFKFSENFLTMITGVLIFYPVCFVSNPVHAIIMGVTMHYSQYLFLTNKVFNKRASENGIKKKNLFNNFWFTIIVYSTIMSILSIFGKHDSDTLKNILIIPIIGQMLHFYLDSQLWKFSVSHNRENILKHLKNT